MFILRVKVFSRKHNQHVSNDKYIYIYKIYVCSEWICIYIYVWVDGMYFLCMWYLISINYCTFILSVYIYIYHNMFDFWRNSFPRRETPICQQPWWLWWPCFNPGLLSVIVPFLGREVVKKKSSLIILTMSIAITWGIPNFQTQMGYSCVISPSIPTVNRHSPLPWYSQWRRCITTIQNQQFSLRTKV